MCLRQAFDVVLVGHVGLSGLHFDALAPHQLGSGFGTLTGAMPECPGGSFEVTTTVPGGPGTTTITTITARAGGGPART